MVNSRHLIVTCGTSQIAAERLKEIGIRKTHQDFAQEISRRGGRRFAVSPELPGLGEVILDYLKSTGEKGTPEGNNIMPFYNELMQRLIGKTPTLGQRHDQDKTAAYFQECLGDRNPESVGKLGAELATLAVMGQNEEEDMKNRRSFVPGTDEVTLLVSDTLSGAFCADFIREFLVHRWVGDRNRVRCVRIAGLKEEINRDEEVDERIYRAIDERLNGERAPAVDQHVIVYSGGFKSVIPTLTSLAIEAKKDMFALFEDTTVLRQNEFRNGPQFPPAVRRYHPRERKTTFQPQHGPGDFV